jgi:hypothetical protein
MLGYRALALLSLVACTRTPPSAGPPPAADASPRVDAEPSASASAPPREALPAPNPDGGTPDLIDRLVAGLARSPMWDNGGFSAIALPANARVEDLIAKVWEVVGFREGHVSKWKTRVVRRVHVREGGPEYVAAIVDTNYGRQVVLLRLLEGKPGGWWQRVYSEDEWPLELPVSDAGFVR